MYFNICIIYVCMYYFDIIILSQFSANFIISLFFHLSEQKIILSEMKFFLLREFCGD